MSVKTGQLYIIVLGKAVPVGDGSASSQPIPISGASITTGPIEQIFGGVATLVGDGSAGSQPLQVNASFSPPALQNVNITEVAGSVLSSAFVPVTIGGTLPAFGSIPTFSINQATPGSTNAVDATNFPVTVDTNSGNLSASTLRMVPATNSPAIANWGQGATGSAVPGGAVLQGFLGQTALPTAVSAGQMVGGLADLFGRAIVRGAPRQLMGKQSTTITGTGATTIVSAQGANVFADISRLLISNTSATGVNVSISDGTISYNIAVPAGDTRGFSGPVDSAQLASSANTAWTATVSAAVTSIVIQAEFVLNR